MPKGSHELVGAGRRLVAAQHDDAKQQFQSGVVALRIDDTDAVPIKDQLLAQQSRDGWGAVPIEDLVSHGLQRRAAPADRHADLAHFEHPVVVLGVPDGNRIVSRQPEARKCLTKAGGLPHRLGEDHQARPIEVQDERQPHLANDAEDAMRVRGGASTTQLPTAISISRCRS